MNVLILAALNKELVPIQNHLLSVFKDTPTVNMNFRKIPRGLNQNQFDFREFQTGKSVDICIN
ncbi:MAG: hypothetical protein Q7J65_04795, partial [Candidatus Marinimicrobia bacterium]|nr:hypothetical protein [Candidatus Neomarinimicrobiota bacterium]